MTQLGKAECFVIHLLQYKHISCDIFCGAMMSWNHHQPYIINPHLEESQTYCVHTPQPRDKHSQRDGNRFVLRKPI